MVHDASMSARSAARGARALVLALAAWLACAVAPAVAIAAAEDPPGRVAQVNLVEGSASMQPSGTSDWSSELLYRPLASGDTVWIGAGSRAEMHVGSTVLRLGSRTELQVLAVDDQNVRLSVLSGSVAMHVRLLDADEYYELDTPAGNVVIRQPGNYRLDVDADERRATLAVRSGWAEASSGADTASLHIDDAAELLADDTPSIRSVRSAGTDSLDQWAEDRDQQEENSASAAYVSREVVGYQDLDGYGNWYVDPFYGPVWTPYVASGWAPYQYGYWSWVRPWGWTWVAAEPWGFAPCHYGRWVQARHGWAWAPGPRSRQRPVFAPALVNWNREHPPELYSHGTHAPPVGMEPLQYNQVYTPPFPASPQYLRNENLSNTHLRHGEIERYIDERPRRPVQAPLPAHPAAIPARVVGPAPVPPAGHPPARPPTVPTPRPVKGGEGAQGQRESPAAERSTADRSGTTPPRVIMAPVGAPPAGAAAPMQQPVVPPTASKPAPRPAPHAPQPVSPSVPQPAQPILQSPGQSSGQSPGQSTAPSPGPSPGPSSTPSIHSTPGMVPHLLGGSGQRASPPH
jgi:hypothetical protein